MIGEPLKELTAWMDEARQRQSQSVCLMTDEPAIYRSIARHGAAAMERSPGDPLTADDLERLAQAIFGAERLGRLGAETGVAEARIKLPDGTYASVTAVRAGGGVTLVARPVRTVSIDWRAIRVPEAMIRAAESPSGLLIVTGPPGSGKTTTCYAILEHLNANRPMHMVTVGYHFDYVLEPKQAVIQERQIGVDVPDMLVGIQSAILQGADVIFVAEVRDLEVFQACLRAAEMSCLVLVQLHMPTPEVTIQRMIALQPDQTRPTASNVLARVTLGVLAQSLLPTTAGKQVAAYSLLMPNDEGRRIIVNGGQGLDAYCDPQMRAEIERLCEQGVVSAEASAEAMRNLGR